METSYLRRELTAPAQIEPARRQFIEREFGDLLPRFASLDLIREIHDALFIEGRSIPVVRNYLCNRQKKLRIIAVTSGKGGVGKTTVAVNLATAVAARGWRVLLLDADLGMANVHVFAGITPRTTLLDVIDGRANLAQAVTRGRGGVEVICGASGVAGLADLDVRTIDSIGAGLQQFAHTFDLLFIDTGAGISAQVLRFLGMAHEMVVVSTPNLAATLDAYGIIKVAREARLPARVHILINQTDREEDAESVFERLRGCSQRFLQFAPVFLGALRRDPAIETSNQCREPLVLAKPRNRNARRLMEMAARLAELESAARNFPEAAASRRSAAA